MQLERDFLKVRDAWVTGRSNPTSIVLMGHSHGTNWTHLLARLYPQTPIALMIDLDGLCNLWESDNRDSFHKLYAEYGGSPWALDISRACTPERIGRYVYRNKDLIYPNILYNLEVQSRRFSEFSFAQFNFLFDLTRNIRPDGSRTNIETLLLNQEGHSYVSFPSSEALRWVSTRIRALPWHSQVPGTSL